MWLALEYSTSVNFREPTPACSKAWSQSTFTLTSKFKKRGQEAWLQVSRQAQLIRGKNGVVLQTWVTLHFFLSCTENNESHRDYEFDIKELVNSITKQKHYQDVITFPHIVPKSSHCFIPLRWDLVQVKINVRIFRESIMKPCLDASHSFLSQTTSDVQIDNICVS